MYTMIQIDENKYDKMSEYTEKMLKYGGKLMSCLEEMGEEYGMSHRGSYGNRMSSYGGRYGERSDRYYSSRGGSMGYKDDDDWDDEEESMGQRRGRRRDSRGRYM